MQMEADLKGWSMNKVSESQLLEIFPENYSLRFGGESKSRNFRGMINDISVSSAPPAWPGIAAAFVGVIGLISTFRDKQNKKQNKSAHTNPLPRPESKF